MNHQTTRKLRANFRRILTPLTSGMGLYISGIEFSSDHSGQIVRVYIDGPEGAGIAQCASLTRESSPLLDAESPINRAYTLEVSSPGMNRFLELPSDFKRYNNFDVTIRHPGRRSKIQGLLISSGEESFEITTDIDTREYRYDEVSSVRLKVDPDDYERIKSTPYIPPTPIETEDN